MNFWYKQLRIGIHIGLYSIWIVGCSRGGLMSAGGGGWWAVELLGCWAACLSLGSPVWKYPKHTSKWFSQEQWIDWGIFLYTIMVTYWVHSVRIIYNNINWLWRVAWGADRKDAVLHNILAHSCSEFKCVIDNIFHFSPPLLFSMVNRKLEL